MAGLIGPCCFYISCSVTAQQSLPNSIMVKQQCVCVYRERKGKGVEGKGVGAQIRGHARSANAPYF